MRWMSAHRFSCWPNWTRWMGVWASWWAGLGPFASWVVNDFLRFPGMVSSVAEGGEWWGGAYSWEVGHGKQ